VFGLIALSLVAGLLASALIVPAVVAGKASVAPVRPPVDDILDDGIEHQVPVPDREWVPPDKIRIDHICSPGNQSNVYAQ
jgi:hypothetical protein